MPRPRIRLTLALQEQIVAFIRAGGYPHVAAEAAGLPREKFERWMRRGQRRDAPPNYRAFARAVHEAEAQARLHAELQAAKEKPLDWLKAGPGKDRAANPGWTSSGKPPGKSADGPDKEALMRMWCEMLDLFGRCAERLEPYPEARAALAAWLKTLTPPPGKRSAKWRSMTRSDTSTPS
ncbi:MAG TPA: hypothetical protein VH643_08890 [Gemmataceae bacterium]|jgi:hypothetical protein